MPTFLKKSPIDPTALRNLEFGPLAEEQRQAARDAGEDVHWDWHALNHVCTGKYTMLNFIPKSIINQFKKLANFYFLIQVALMSMGKFTDLYEGSIEPFSTGATLFTVIACTMIMEARDDIARHKQDAITNATEGKVLVKGEDNGKKYIERTVRWDEIRTLDLVLLRVNDKVPADLIILTSSNDDGLCYVETKNIDGETNLKIRTCPDIVVKQSREGVNKDEGAHPDDADDAQNGHDGYGALLDDIAGNMVDMHGNIEYEPPNNRIDNFSGKVRFKPHHEGEYGEFASLDEKQILLRGSIMRNTTWAIGLCVFTGSETKVMQNTRETPSKNSHLQTVVNGALIVIIIAQVTLCAICDISYNVWMNRNVGENPQKIWYLYPPGVKASTTEFPSEIAYFFTFFILFCNLVPISLYVTLEFCNAIQAQFINQDRKMYCGETDTPALCRSTNLVQELGQIEYIFSDKTGTLTKNMMQFKCCAVAGEEHLFGTEEGKEELPDGEFSDPKLLEARADDKNSAHDNLEKFLLVMAVGHTCTVSDEDEENPGKYLYNAESPDEKALVEGCALCGLTFVRREGDVIVLYDTRGKPEGKVLVRRYRVLAINEFNSTRKRASSIVRELEPCELENDKKANSDSSSDKGKIFILCKGADNFMMELADKSGDWTSSEKGQKLMNSQLKDCAVKGLRTLVMSYREISSSEFSTWSKTYNDAATAMDGRKEKLMAAAEQIEKDLIVCGASAIEDKLQDDVANTISDLHGADIKLWVLTGDKMETAINIGRSTKVLVPGMRVLKFALPAELANDSTSDAAKEYVEKHLKTLVESVREALKQHGDPRHMSVDEIDIKLKELGNGTEKDAAASNSSGGGDDEEKNGDDDVGENDVSVTWGDLQNLALVITGPVLGHIVGLCDAKGNRETERADRMEGLLRDVGVLCKVVIACRVSPLQKALLVRLIKLGVKPPPITLAIGDGANDVSMIQEAQVGVGISGKEGMQAVNASDFAIGQFSFLRRLLLVHGRWNYRRACKVVRFTFYKNVVITFCIFFYTFVTGFSGTCIFEDSFYALFNVGFAALPIICIGIFDQDVTEELMLKQPWLYMSGRMNLDLNTFKMVETLILSLAHSVIICFWPLIALSGMAQENQLGGLYSFGAVVYSCMIMVVNLRSTFITYTWNKFSIGALIFTLALYFAFLLGYSYMYSYNPYFYYVGIELVYSPMFWVVLVGVPATAMLLDIVTEYLRLQFFYDPIDAARDVLRLNMMPKDDAFSLIRYKTAGEQWGDVDQPMSHIKDMMYQNRPDSHGRKNQAEFAEQFGRGTGGHKHGEDPTRLLQKVDDTASAVTSFFSPKKLFGHKKKKITDGAAKTKDDDHNLDSGFAYSHVENDAHYGHQSRKVVSAARIANSKTTSKSQPQRNGGAGGSGTGNSKTRMSNKAAHRLHRRNSQNQAERQPGAKKLNDPHAREPKDLPFTQQKLKSWRPIWSTFTITIILICLGIGFIAFGAVVNSASHDIQTVKAIYGCPYSVSGGDEENDDLAGGVCDAKTYLSEDVDQDSHTIHSHKNSNDNTATNQAEQTAGNSQPRIARGDKGIVTFTLKEDMEYPIKVFYELSDFFQSHNIYRNDKCALQLQGDPDYSDADYCSDFCKHYLTEATTDKEYYPCGMIANSMFNDIFTITTTPPAVLGSNTDFGGAAAAPTIRTTGIAWEGDREKLYKNRPTYPGDRDTAKELYLDTGPLSSAGGYVPSSNNNVEDERFMIWMRVAALPTFSKLYGIIEAPAGKTKMEKGTMISFEIQSAYRVASFGGTKGLILSTTGWIGARNHFLGIAYIATGAFCLILAIIFIVKEKTSPRPLPDTSKMNGKEEEGDEERRNKPGRAEILPEGEAGEGSTSEKKVSK